MKMRSQWSPALSTVLANIMILFPLFGFMTILSTDAATVPDQCNEQFSKIGVCINYATGKSASPSDECCSTVKKIKDDNPVCLCYVIQMTHQGQASLKQMGLQESKLLQLPSACKLANASIAECPKLLNLSPSSPDAAIFKNSSSSSPVTTNPTGNTPSTAKDEKSVGAMHRPGWVSPIAITVIVTIFVCLFQTGQQPLVSC